MRQYPRRVALPLFYAVVAIVWLALWGHHFQAWDPIDTATALLLGAGWTFGMLFMLLETEGWTVRALGVLGAVSGDAVVYSYAFGARWDQGVVPAPALVAALDLGRAFLLVGMPLFIAGVVWTILLRRRERAADLPADEPREPTGLP